MLLIEIEGEIGIETETASLPGQAADNRYITLLYLIVLYCTVLYCNVLQEISENHGVDTNFNL